MRISVHDIYQLNKKLRQVTPLDRQKSGPGDFAKRGIEHGYCGGRRKRESDPERFLIFFCLKRLLKSVEDG